MLFKSQRESNIHTQSIGFVGTMTVVGKGGDTKIDINRNNDVQLDQVVAAMHL